MNKNGIVIVLLVVLIVSVISGTYLIINKDNKEVNNTDQSTNNNVVSECNVDYNDYVNALLGKEKMIRINYSENDVEGLKLGIRSMVINSSNELLISTYDDTNKGKDLKEKYKENYVISKDVLKFYVLEYGNAGAKAILTIKKDGSISALINSKITKDNISWIDNISSLKNITDIYLKPVYLEDPSGKYLSGHTIVAIDINGNETQIDNYLN